MSERNLEELSALMDGEISELEVRRVLKNIEQDQVMCQKWARYQLVSSVLKGETRGAAQQWQAVDLSARVAQALDSEPAHSGAIAASGGKVKETWLRPFANVAVAASVSAAVILGWQAVNQQPATSGPVAASGPVAVMPTGSGSAVASVSPAASGLMPVAQTSGAFRATPATSQQQIIRYNPASDDQLNYYLISHSGNAAFNTASGVAPYARVVMLKPAPEAAQQPQSGR